jgi:hypothetical protein
MNNTLNKEDNDTYIIIKYNFTANESIELCEKKQFFNNIQAFFYCFDYFYCKLWFASTIQLFVCIGIIVFNFLVMLLMWANSDKITKFDQIIFGHSMIDGVTGVVDSSLYQVYCMFGYWPVMKKNT